MKPQKEKLRPSVICKDKFVLFFNNPKDVNPDEIKDVNISGEMTFRSRAVKDYFKITFNIKNVVVESVYEKVVYFFGYIDIDGNVFFYLLNMSHYSTEDFEDDESDDCISVGTEDSYDTESLCSNDSYESSLQMIVKAPMKVPKMIPKMNFI